jgi:pilus assembly protein CpaB
MNTAPIVVLATADGAGGIAASFASGSDDKPLLAEPVAQLPAMDVPVAVLSTGIRAPRLTETLK